MPLSMHTLSVTAFSRALANLKSVLEKAKAHAIDHKIQEAVYVNARLYPDMLPL